MAKVIKAIDTDVTHLRGKSDSLCGEPTGTDIVIDSSLTCTECARIALQAIELTTKVERREWRKL